MKECHRFLERLILGDPHLGDLYLVHLRDYSEVLPHVLMGDIARDVIAQTQIQSQTLSPLYHEGLSYLVSQLEAGLETGHHDVQELIVVSFLENFVGEEMAIQKLKPYMGPNLLREAACILGKIDEDENSTPRLL